MLIDIQKKQLENLKVEDPDCDEKIKKLEKHRAQVWHNFGSISMIWIQCCILGIRYTCHDLVSWPC